MFTKVRVDVYGDLVSRGLSVIRLVRVDVYGDLVWRGLARGCEGVVAHTHRWWTSTFDDNIEREADTPETRSHLEGKKANEHFHILSRLGKQKSMAVVCVCWLSIMTVAMKKGRRGELAKDNVRVRVCVHVSFSMSLTALRVSERHHHHHHHRRGNRHYT